MSFPNINLPTGFNQKKFKDGLDGTFTTSIGTTTAVGIGAGMAGLRHQLRQNRLPSRADAVMITASIAAAVLLINAFKALEWQKK
jgi:hypothetical protein